MNTLTIPLFPLHTVLLPGGFLSLRIFEPRYLDMVSYCFRQKSGFGVCLIREGKEIGKAALPYNIGTLAHIIDWDQLPDGFLRIDAQGAQRFEVNSHKVITNQLIEAEVTLIPNELDQNMPSDLTDLSVGLKELIKEQGALYHKHVLLDYNNATWVSQRLTELLDISLPQRQSLLELNNPLERLNELEQLIQSL
ncbi:MAG: LON peptidase substrate-binding domain-containing protein [Thiomargarita sp.]|nr:LON peptidase substrate-binding domain-containing protein [Thiomargarita sp.]